MSSSTTNNRGSKLSRFLKVPIRFLIRARDFYIQSMNQCSVVAGYGTAMGCPAGQVGSGLPRSFSVGSGGSRNDDDYRALLRVSSLKTMTNKIESDLARRRWRTPPAAVPRSCSVGVGRIDEDKPCEFGHHDEVVVRKDVFPRSRSYANNSRRDGMV